MRSAMPFLGVRVPEVRRLTREAARDRPPAGLAGLERDARRLWDEAEYREERYAASALCGLRTARGRWELVPLHRHVIVTGAWWDHVDETVHRLAELHDAHPGPSAGLARRWSVEPDRWLRRAAILSQLGRRDRVDPALLAAVIEPNLADREFFVRKAIGWALREYARVRPEWVRSFVVAHEATISPLSRPKPSSISVLIRRRKSRIRAELIGRDMHSSPKDCPVQMPAGNFGQCSHPRSRHLTKE